MLSFLLLLRQRRGAAGVGAATHNGRRRGQRPDAATKYLRRATSGAAGNGLGNTIKYMRRTTSGAAGYGRTQRSSTCGA
jgi:hypothetical protein